MSRYKFEKLLKNENIDDLSGIKDIFGNSIQDWQERGAFGYDKPLLTYFLQLDSEQGDLPDVWYGANCGEIKSPYLLVAILKNIFKKDFNYDTEVINFLIKERNDDYKNDINASEILKELNRWDGVCRDNQNVTNSYIQSGFFKHNI
ncbi:MAG: hypothetical protein ACYCSQ_00660 [bacterium]